MQVVHVSSEKSWRGGENQIANLIRENRDPEVKSVVLCRQGSAFEAYCIENNIRYSAGSFHWPGILRTAYTLKALGNQSDIVHAHTAKAHFLAYLAQRMGMKTPVIVARHVAFRPGGSRLTRNRYEHPGVARIICISDGVKQVMTSYLDRNRDKCVTIKGGIDLAEFKNVTGSTVREEFGIGNDTFLVGVTAALTPEKGIDTFLRVAAAVSTQRSGVRFMIAGSGELEQPLRQLAETLRIADKVVFTGYRDDIPQLLHELDLFLITSVLEGFPNAILEAFASHVPVVGTEVGGIPELIRHGKTGMLAAPGDVETLAGHVAYMIDQPAEARRMADNAAVLVREFSKEQTAQKTYALYREVLEKP